MNSENFSLHITGDVLWFFHNDLERLIDSVTEEEKGQLESHCREIEEKFGKKIKLVWGYTARDGRMENVLGHISYNSESLDLADAGGIKSGQLKYKGHNLMFADVYRAPVFSVATMYVSLLMKQAVEKF